MTIIAGFKCEGGIVVCADTQETLSIGNVPLSKRKVPKLRFEQVLGSKRNLSGLPDTALAVCGAGYGPFIDKLADKVWEAVQIAPSFADACDSAEQTVKDLYDEYGKIYQSGSCPEVELIYGIKAEGASRLFQASGPVVNEKHGYSACGSGSYMADFLASSMYRQELSLTQCVILAAYILFQTKEYADGCGGESHIAVLRDQDTSGTIDSNRIEIITELLDTFHDQMGNLLLLSVDLGIKQDEFAKNMNVLSDLLRTFRESAQSKIKDWDSWWARIFPNIELDELGIIVPKKKLKE